MYGLASDLVTSMRILRRRPVFSVLIITTLAVGIGASTAIFSVVDAVLLRELPYPDPDRLIQVMIHFKGTIGTSNSGANFHDYREQISSLESVTAYQFQRWHLGENGEPRFVLGASISREFFTVLGVRPMLGRGFVAADEREDSGVAVISYGLWQRSFGGEPEAVGQTLTLDSRPVAIIGVMPPGFRFPNREVELWRPLWIDASAEGYRADHVYNVIGRMTDGVTLGQTNSELVAYGKRMVEEYPESYSTFEYGASVRTLHEAEVGSVDTALYVLLGAVLLVLLIACVNVTNLLLVRAETRCHELAVRAALGASRGRMVRQLLIESLMLAIGGGLLGLLFAALGLRGLLAVAGEALPRVHDVHLDLRVLIFTMAVSAVAGLVTGAIPAARVSGLRLGGSLAAAGRAVVAGGRSRLRSVLVVIEIALAVVLVVGAGLMIRTLAELMRVDVGFRTDHLLTARITLPKTSYQAGGDVAAFRDGLIEQLEALPGVLSVGAARQLPLTSEFGRWSIQISGKEVETIGEAPTSHLQMATPGYFRAMAVGLVSGRLINDGDVDGQPLVTLVNETFVRQLLDGGPAVGTRVRLWGDETPWAEVVGVVRDVRKQSPDSEPSPTVYVPHAQLTSAQLEPDDFLLRLARSMALVVHAEGDASVLSGPIRELVRGLDPSVPVTSIRTMNEIRAEAVSDREFPTVLLVVFSWIALALAVVGVYGVAATSASRRTHEIGIRMAVGADAPAVRRMIVRQGFAPVVTGIVIGLAGAVAGARGLRSLLFNVEVLDPMTLIAVATLVSVSAVLASYVPALRSSKIEPATVLRSE